MSQARVLVEKDRRASAVIERRQSVRRPCSLEAFCRPVGDKMELAWLATTLNISTSGLSLLSSRRFALATFLVVELHNASQSFSRALLASVVYARKDQNQGGWLIGCSLTSRLSDDELEAFLS